jgi:catechol 2,3-dioxygenase
MNITHLNNRLTAKHNGRSMIPFADRGAHPPNAKPSRRTNEFHTTGALRLGHVHLKVRDLNRSVPFYTRMLGLRLTEWAGRYAFLAIGSEHHSLALEEIGAWAVNPSRRAVGIAHFAFEVPNRATFGRMRRKLLDAGMPIISRNNGISWAMRFKDPDQNEIEIYVDRRHAPGGATLWKGRWHGPLDIEQKAESLVPRQREVRWCGGEL